MAACLAEIQSVVEQVEDDEVTELMVHPAFLMSRYTLAQVFIFNEPKKLPFCVLNN